KQQYRMNHTAYFDRLGAGDLTILVYLNLQDAYRTHLEKAEPMPDAWKRAYEERLCVRIDLLLDMIVQFKLPLYFPFVEKALSDVPASLLRPAFDATVNKRSLQPLADTPAPLNNDQPLTVALMNGGPASGKSTMLAKGEIPE